MDQGIAQEQTTEEQTADETTVISTESSTSDRDTSGIALADLIPSTATVESGEDFYFTVTLNGIASANVAFRFTMQQILAEDQIEKKIVRETLTIPAARDEETFSQRASHSLGDLVPGRYLLTASRTVGTFEQAAVIEVVPSTRGDLEASGENGILGIAIYTPITRTRLLPANPRSPAVPRESLLYLPVKPKEKYKIEVQTGVANEQDAVNYNTKVRIQLVAQVGGVVIDSWKEKGLNTGKRITEFYRFATEDGTETGDSLPAGTYSLRARREKNDEGEDFVATTLIVE